ncbi:hypothetical protein [Actinacidiphila oryziradicis]|uniref:hypothetical protein n=1 Tax=Actinacidiphila oryziradicis TaxID=2571141 RepID=UPI00145EAA84|nr:hypothetical protein [Actinacidiphila oryziradicis]
MVGAAAFVLVGHEREVVGEQQGAGLAHQVGQRLAVPVELLPRGRGVLAPAAVVDQLQVGHRPQDLLLGELGPLRRRRHDDSCVRAAHPMCPAIPVRRGPTRIRCA